MEEDFGGIMRRVRTFYEVVIWVVLGSDSELE